MKTYEEINAIVKTATEDQFMALFEEEDNTEVLTALGLTKEDWDLLCSVEDAPEVEEYDECEGDPWDE